MIVKRLIITVALIVRILCGADLSIAASLPVLVTVKFTPSDAIFPNPERGWWQFTADNFVNVTADQLAGIRANGQTLGYGVVRLDEFRDRPLSPEILAKLDHAFGLARQEGIKIILRFTYNYPQSSDDYDNAKDAPLAIVLGHIKQFAPLVNKNKDVLAIFQGGLIGAWGEQHTSSNKLDTPENKIIIRDALLAALDTSIVIQWRYPRDIISWAGTLKNEDSGRIAFHNDCFLSSPSDVGTYAEDTTAKVERAAMAVVTDTTFHSGEVCDAQKDSLRKDCKDILREAATYHMSALNLDYYVAFHDNWKRQGCFDEITRKMGYRFVLKTAQLTKQSEGNYSLDVVVENKGWARLYKNRPLRFEAKNGGITIDLNSEPNSLTTVAAGKAVPFNFNFPLVTKSKSIEFCLSAPDLEPTLKADVRFAIRFANQPKPDQRYDDTSGKFCFDMILPN